RRRLLRDRACEEPARPGIRNAAREPGRSVAPRGPVESRGAPLVVAAAPEVLRLRRPARAYTMTAMPAGQRSVLREGVTAGVPGAAVVALGFLIFDSARGKPLLTPALLGAAVFYGIRDPTGVPIALGSIIGYTILHGLAFIAFGVIAAALIAV